MITEQDLRQAIAECQGERHPNANTCIKLAAFYTILDHTIGPVEENAGPPAYSYAAGPEPAGTILKEEIDYKSGTAFSEAIDGKDPARVWPIVDELLTAVYAIQPRLYAATLRKIEDI